jgi:transposase
MRRHEISDEQWVKIKDLRPGEAGDPGRAAEDNRLFIKAVCWIARTGAPWRDLPKRLGEWNLAFQRFNRLCKRGMWDAFWRSGRTPDLECLMLDSTTIRAHQPAARAIQKNRGRRGPRPIAWGIQHHASLGGRRRGPPTRTDRYSGTGTRYLLSPSPLGRSRTAVCHCGQGI